MDHVYVVVTGPPAAGKSTLSRSLADELDLPLLAKDALKQELVDSLGAPDVEVSRELGRAAVRLLLAAARDVGRGVVDSVWVDRDVAVRDLTALGDVVEVFCRADLDLMRRRYRERAPTKPAGHFDGERGDVELWPVAALRPLAGGWPVVEVDTSREVDVAAVRRRVEAAAG
jgi:predicted kinase